MSPVDRREPPSALVYSALSLFVGLSFGFLGGIATFSGRLAIIETKVSMIYTSLEQRGLLVPIQRTGAP